MRRGRRIFQKICAWGLVASMATVMFPIETLLPRFTIRAEAKEAYPYTLFAASDMEGAISVDARQVYLGGNATSNGTIERKSITDVTGSEKQYAQEDMLHLEM